jgi:hypothetical protein
VNQPIDTSPPWWDGTIAIPFSVEEWGAIVSELYMLYEIPTFPENDHDLMLIKVIDRIQKGIEIQ